jgi:two-component system, LytTR family, sensor histidine kinase AlgZ
MQDATAQDSQLLSAFHEPSRGLQPAPRLVFDACHVGVVLRAVLFVEVVAAVGAMYVSSGWADWVARASLVTGVALPGVLTWLLVSCALKDLLARLPESVQAAIGVVFGLLAGLVSCGFVAVMGLHPRPPWLAGAATGAMFSGALVMALIWRARGAAPAATSARLAELQSRIRPHFLFNTLNSAIALVRAEPAKAEALLEDLSDLFRHALEDWEGNATLDAEVELARRYLAIEQVRFGERLQVQWDVDPRAGAARLPPLLLQPLVENAVRHGVEPSDAGALVKISTQRRGSSVVIKVANTVPAGPGEPGHGLALDNARARLSLLHDVEGKFQHGLRDGVFQVRIEVPAL